VAPGASTIARSPRLGGDIPLISADAEAMCQERGYVAPIPAPCFMPAGTSCRASGTSDNASKGQVSRDPPIDRHRAVGSRRVSSAAACGKFRRLFARRHGEHGSQWCASEVAPLFEKAGFEVRRFNTNMTAEEKYLRKAVQVRFAVPGHIDFRADADRRPLPSSPSPVTPCRQEVTRP
jgi:hypothetical protein